MVRGDAGTVQCIGPDFFLGRGTLRLCKDPAQSYYLGVVAAQKQDVHLAAIN